MLGCKRQLRAAYSPSPLTLTLSFKHHSHLLCLGQCGAVAQIENRHCRPLASVDQLFENGGRKIGQPQLQTDVPPRQPHGDGKVTNRNELAGFHTPPPTPGPTDGAQNMGGLCLILAGVGSAFRPLGLIQTGSK